MAVETDVITVRPMTEQDIAWAQQLALQTPEIHSNPSQPKCDTSEEWMGNIGDQDCVILVAEFMGTRAGYAFSYLPLDSNQAEIADIIVDNSLRGLWIGAHLLDETLALLGQRGARSVDAVVRFDNAVGAAFLNAKGFNLTDKLNIFDVYEREL